MPYCSQTFKLSWVMGFSYILVFMAGAMIFGHLQARTVVVSISSAIPRASFAITLAEAGAMRHTSAAFANDTCSTLNSKFRSKVSTRHLWPVRVSKVMGLIKFVAFSVMRTWTLAFAFPNILARPAILYAAMLPVTPKSTVFPSKFMAISSFSPLYSRLFLCYNCYHHNIIPI